MSEILNVLAPMIAAVTAIMVIGLIILIPVAGFTARFAVRPVLDALAPLRNGSSSSREIYELEQRVRELEQRLEIRSALDKTLTSGNTPEASRNRITAENTGGGPSA